MTIRPRTKQNGAADARASVHAQTTLALKAAAGALGLGGTVLLSIPAQASYAYNPCYTLSAPTPTAQMIWQSSIGANGSAGADAGFDGPGHAGHAGDPSSSLSGTLDDDANFVGLSSVGGTGGEGSNANGGVQTNGGGVGSLGGAGGSITLTTAAGSAVDPPAQSTSQPGVRAAVCGYSAGGQGGMAGLPDNLGPKHASGTGGTAGPVTVTIDGNVTSSVAGIIAIAAGGDGGDGKSGSHDTGVSGDGGEAGSGETGGDVTVSIGAVQIDALQGNPSNVSYEGVSGVFASSVGGDGGAGGGGEYTSVYQGGAGGDAGIGGTVTVSLAAGGSITMAPSSDSNAAIWALSVGGVGGAGGAGSPGGAGGAGGDGGTVNVTISGAVTAADPDSPGVLAQSFGGEGAGGGGGGGWFTASGGAGATGGNGGTVMVMLSGGSITTGVASDQSTNSDGIVAQSIGGGGGNGGDADGAWDTIGGNAGVGASSGPVTVNIDQGATITTNTDRSSGVLAQSIGGGGGNGGNANGVSLFGNLTIGGDGGGGGTADTVDASSGGTIVTSGDHAPGLLLQSIGGGGGKGGAAYGASVGVGVSAGVALGGTGGAGGAGQDVGLGFDPNFTNTVTGVISTSGADSNGILAQSIGGGGGAGGPSAETAVALGFDAGEVEIPAISVAAAIGGSGGTGSAGGTVTIGNGGLIATSGAGSRGLVGQSIGGGGGDGGDASAVAVAAGLDSPMNVSVSVALGGSGADGGDGGAVTGTNAGLIVTTGGDADGLLLQSIGGGGGAGNSGDGSATGLGSEDTLKANVTLGGTGGSGGAGQTVTLTNTGAILTLGDGASGMTAQSIGGGGGRGGGGAGNAGGGTFSATVRLGGTGGSGGAGQTVTLTNTGAILTYGADGAGMIAQSIGGGGGVGGKAATSLGDSTSTGDGGNGSSSTAAGPVLTSLVNEGAQQAVAAYGSATGLITLAEDLLGDSAAQAALSSTGSVFQSSLNTLSSDAGTDVNDGDSDSLKATISLGGTGGAGNTGGEVVVTNQGAIATVGKMSDGILAQSIGGGGGKGGAANSAAAGATINTAISVGADGGAAGAGNTVQVTNAAGATIATIGSVAPGLVAQSIGGGGGEGGASGTSTGLLQGIGLALGGNGGNSADGNTTMVENDGTITTASHDAPAVIAQSIGGGGGIIKTLARDEDASGGQATSGGSYQVNLTFGGSYGGGGDGGEVQVTNTGSIVTSGNDSYGILAQSIGGGGGLVLGGTPTGTSFFGSGTMSGDGQQVTVMMTGGSIGTSGQGSVGILAQSIGGGGGLAGGTGLGVPLTSFTESGSHTGNGGPIDITAYSGTTVDTTGSYAPAIQAESIGGGGGRVTTSTDTYDGSAGGAGAGQNVRIFAAGIVSATGVGSPGIFAESTGQGGTGAPIVVFVTPSGTISGGTDVNAGDGSGAGVYIVDGGASAAATNVIDNFGTITSVNGASGTAIYSTGGYTTVTNESSGTITGAINLNGNGSCTGSTNCTSQSNAAASKGDIVNDGTVRSGSINLGGGTLTNAGTLDVRAGGSGKATLSGNYVATTGVLHIGADFAKGTADQLAVSGNVDLGPQSSVQVDVADWMKGSVPVLTAGGTLTEDPPSAQATNAAYLFGLQTVQSGNTLAVQTVSNLRAAAAGFGSNQQAVANNLNQIWNIGSEFSDAISTLATVTGTHAYQTSLTSLANEAVGGVVQSKRASSDVFTDAMISCGSAAQADGTACTWFKATGSNTSLAASGGDQGYNQDAVTYQIGGQKEFLPGWFFGASLGYETSWLTASANNGQVSGQSGLAGLMIKHLMGPWTLTGVVDAGYGSYQSSRQINVGSTTGSATASPDVVNTGLHLKAAYKVGLQQGWYMNPSLSVSMLYLGMPSYSENGPTAFNLNVRSSSQVVGGVSPMFEIGRDAEIDRWGKLNGYIGVGAALYTGNDWSSQASFENAPAGAGSFTVTSNLPDALAKVEAGLNLLSVRGFDIKLNYIAQVAPSFLAQSVTGHFAYSF